MNDLIFGLRAIIEAIEAGKEIDKILLKKDMQSDLAKELFAAVKGRNIPVVRVPVERIDRITKKNHQGAIAFISPITYQRITDIIPSLYEAGKSPLIVVLDGVTDVRNFGAIARTCECAGVDAIVLPQSGSAPVNADAIKTSAGALMSIPVCREHNLAYVLQFMKDSGIKLIAASEKAAKDYTLLSYTEPTAIVMGAEDIGISQSILALCDESARIPILGEIASLNVSVAAGILIYEAVRQRK
ncbi:MAG: 23S rRNA (guanosine(2251)-2'-O)-methyltransferase RlmB [Paludibacteraceae bacterium]|jgi:23S rRNA (guanosine2251-2'-O)-methyltransferase|nr:23S rRNA (guanosine(2251)-2'-O)-methyltransferase RlmB [Paludibacteraceae bacterium]OQA48149.1 MAG: putative TrmH family tRNA/rRNA methyltransferase [Bacteroidetes bacterium ADurb.Bin302]HPG55201.1 23S rRNA (guanosine(2251)-2'-O)-methyltransferase RlmB [Candidatus Enterocola sp.]